MEAFTDGVIAIVITIMVLEIKAPAGASFAALRASLPVFLAYALSYVNVGVIWNNHHHMLQATEHVNGAVLWANLFLLFWVSLMPLAIRWMDEGHFAAVPTATYGAVLFMVAIGYIVLERQIIACNGLNSALAKAVGRDRKSFLSVAMYAVAIPLAFVEPWIAIALYVATALLWFVPNRRIERALHPG